MYANNSENEMENKKYKNMHKNIVFIINNYFIDKHLHLFFSIVYDNRPKVTFTFEPFGGGGGEEEWERGGRKREEGKERGKWGKSFDKRGGRGRANS